MGGNRKPVLLERGLGVPQTMERQQLVGIAMHEHHRRAGDRLRRQQIRPFEASGIAEHAGAGRGPPRRDE